MRRLVAAALLVAGARGAFAQAELNSFPDVGPNQIELYPYWFGGFDRHHSYLSDAGLDFQTRVGNLQWLGSINPDFRNVPLDVLSLDFSYFERLPAESRPFFLAGSGFFSGVPLATQRITTFDAATKSYGNLDSKTRIGLLDAADFWQSNAFAASVSRDTSKNTDVDLGVTAWHQPDFTNAAFSGGGQVRMGPWTASGGVHLTRDSVIGSGDSEAVGLSYDGKGVFANFAGSRTTANYLDRLDYYTETDIQGARANVGFTKKFGAGPIARSTVAVAGSYYNFLDGQPYRRLVSLSENNTLSCGVTVGGTLKAEDFLNYKDRLGTVFAIVPFPGRKASISGNFTGGELAGQHYADTFVSLNWTPTPKLGLAASFQNVIHFQNLSQTILHASYAFNDSCGVLGRLIQLQGDTNFYLAYFSSPKKGPRYEVILGDPNAQKFQRAIAFKLVFPLGVKY